MEREREAPVMSVQHDIPVHETERHRWGTLRMERAINDSGVDSAVSPPMGTISIRNVSHRFDESNLVTDNVSIDIPTGTFTSIVGPSGCGKTTLLNLIAGTVEVRSGTVDIGGSQPLLGRTDIAYMLARDALLPWRTALGNVEFGMEVRNVDKTERRERATHYLQLVGLDEFTGRYPKELSHGMRQRVALARTFALDASILLMDEPFGALDAQTRLQLQDVLLELWQQSQSTVVFITHDLSEAAVLSDRVVVMSGRPGRIVHCEFIDIPRPRSAEALQGDQQYRDLVGVLWTKLQMGFTSS